MSSGAMINIMVAFILTPVVTRIYSKEEFGLFYIYSSFIAIGTLLVSGMYPHALVVPKCRIDFLALLKLCFCTTIVGTLFLVILVAGFGDWILTLVGAEAIIPFKYFVPLGLFIGLINLIFLNWNVRRKEFRQGASSNVAASVGAKACQIGYGITIEGVFPGLIYSDLFAKAFSTFILFSKEMNRDLFLSMKRSYMDVKKIAIEYIKYPTYLLASNFINRLTGDVPLFFLSAYFGAGAVGAFGFASAMLNIPYSVIGSSIAPVYFQRANELYQSDPESLKSFTLDSYNRMLIFGCVAFGFVFAFGDVLFRVLFSDQWELAGQMAMILSIYFVFKLISSPFTRIFRVVRREELTLRINIVLAVLRLVSICSGILLDSILITIGIYSFANLLGYFYNNVQVLAVCRINIVDTLRRSSIYLFGIFGAFSVVRFVLSHYLIFFCF